MHIFVSSLMTVGPWGFASEASEVQLFLTHVKI